MSLSNSHVETLTLNAAVFGDRVLGLPWWLSGKESACNVETWVRSLRHEDPLEKKMATHSSILAWEIPWTEEPGWAIVHEVTKSQT